MTNELRYTLRESRIFPGKKVIDTLYSIDPETGEKIVFGSTTPHATSRKGMR